MPEEEYIEINCPNCDGAGYLEIWWEGPRGEAIISAHTCEMCGRRGTFMVPAEPDADETSPDE